MSSMIELHDLRKVYGPTTAADGVSMQVKTGEIFGFLGANGAGKTTTIRMICGLTRPTSGGGTINGLDIWRDRHRIRTQFGYVAQKFSLYGDLTVVENLRFFGGAYRIAPATLEERIPRLLAQMDLEPHRDKMAGHLSGGMKQLLALACALIHDPPLLLLDEPTAGLDPVHRQQLWNLLYDLGTAGKTIVVTTHYMDEAERCTQVGFLQKGRLLAQSPPRTLRSSFREKLLEVHCEPAMTALAAIRQHPAVLGAALRSGRIRVYSGQAPTLLADWQQRWPFENCTWHGFDWIEPDMEDVFSAYSQSYHALLKPISSPTV
ncbi:MAG: ABC transporter ATP-binding protein [Chthoniobacteraceae bacterium]